GKWHWRLGPGTVQVPATERREGHEENTKRIRRKYQANTKAPPNPLACKWLAPGLHLALGWPASRLLFAFPSLAPKRPFGHSWQDFLCARKNPAFPSFNPNPLISLATAKPRDAGALSLFHFRKARQPRGLKQPAGQDRFGAE